MSRARVRGPLVELTIALHYVFNTPEDRLVWDVGHQSYPHKILTGRRQLMGSLRQQGGLSGFPNRGESPYDTFGVGHSSTSISAALGMAAAALTGIIAQRIFQRSGDSEAGRRWAEPAGLVAAGDDDGQQQPAAHLTPGPRATTPMVLRMILRSKKRDMFLR